MTGFQPKIEWKAPLTPSESVGGPGFGKLLGRIEIDGVPHHIEAFEVEDRQHPDDPDAATQESTLSPRRYVMLVTPYQA